MDRTLFESLVGAAQHKTAAMGERLHAAAELATGQKVAAVAASAAALAGGGTAMDELASHRPSARASQVEEVAEEPAAEAPAEPPRASDGQHLGLQPPAVQGAFVATHGGAAAQRWADEHEAELARPAP